MRESELERALGALVPHNLSGVRWKEEEAPVTRHRFGFCGMVYVQFNYKYVAPGWRLRRWRQSWLPCAG
jgi:hypothetical protein